jgi:hypothetical protein
MTICCRSGDPQVQAEIKIEPTNLTADHPHFSQAGTLPQKFLIRNRGDDEKAAPAAFPTLVGRNVVAFVTLDIISP